jgi:hypothetical protein
MTDITEARQKIIADTKAFLRAGGKIYKARPGESGVFIGPARNYAKEVRRRRAGVKLTKGAGYQVNRRVP